MWLIPIQPRFILVFILNIITVFGVITSVSAIAENHGNDTELLARKINVMLTPEEKSWLRDHQTIQIAGPQSFPPFHYYEKDSVLKGMSADYIRIIMKSLGVRVKIQKDLPWPEVLKRAKNREVDLISCSAKMTDREVYLSFSEPYLSFPLVIISRKNGPFIGGLDDLDGKKLAVIKKISPYEKLKQFNINIVPIYVSSPLEGLEAVSFGQADVSINNLATASYLIQKNGLNNITIAAPTPFGYYNLHFAVRKDWPQLTGIINKALDSISPEQHLAIRNRWLSVRYEHGIQVMDVLKWVLLVVSITTIILTVFLIWNRRLKREIVERKQLEGQLIKAKKQADAANKAKSEFLSNISHELRTPMHGILGYSKFAIDRIENLSREKTLEYFNEIKNSGDNLLLLLNDLLDLSKMEAGKIEYNFTPSTLSKLVQMTISELDVMSKEKNISINFFRPDFDNLRSMDSQKITQVIRNLLSNAIKFSRVGGKIEIKIENENENDNLLFSIYDQGVGIPSNELETVFDKFMQSSKTKTGAGGTGLGLSICKEIIEAHRGKIWVKNNPEGGVTFSLVLPYKQEMN